MANSVLLAGANVTTSGQGYVNSSSANKKDNEAIIGSCYDELGNYSAPSMINITNIWNHGFKEDSNNFYGEHMQYCDLYGNAAKQYGNAIGANSDANVLSQAVTLIKNATQIAVEGLKALISKEEQFKTQNNISDGEKTSSEKNEIKTEQDTDKISQQDNHSEGFFTKVGKSLKSFFNGIFG